MIYLLNDFEIPHFKNIEHLFEEDNDDKNLQLFRNLKGMMTFNKMIDALKNNPPRKSRCYLVIIPFLKCYSTAINELEFESTQDYK